MAKRKHRRPSPSQYTEFDLPSTFGNGYSVNYTGDAIIGGWRAYKRMMRLHSEGKGEYNCPHCRMENKEVILQGRAEFLDHLTLHRIRKALDNGNMPEVQLQGDKM